MIRGKTMRTPPPRGAAQTMLSEAAAEGGEAFNPEHTENILMARQMRDLEEAVGDALKDIGGGSYVPVAQRLDAITGKSGEHVSDSTLRAAFAEKNVETRNYPRLKWLVLVLHDPRVQALLRPQVHTPEEKWRIAEGVLAAEYPGVLKAINKKLGGGA